MALRDELPDALFAVLGEKDALGHAPVLAVTARLLVTRCVPAKDSTGVSLGAIDAEPDAIEEGLGDSDAASDRVLNTCTLLLHTTVRMVLLPASTTKSWPLPSKASPTG